jgi:hypothetical protein
MISGTNAVKYIRMVLFGSPVPLLRLPQAFLRGILGMSADKIEVLQAQLARLRERERVSRNQADQIKRELASMDRKRETRLLCILGRAWLALGERNPGSRPPMQRFLDGYISRTTDRDILRGTPWAVSALAAKPAPTSAPEAAYESDDSQHA